MWAHLVSGEVYYHGLSLGLSIVLSESADERFGNID